jgi:hypothetical protein
LFRRGNARLSYANVAATLALVLALTSPAWGAPVANLSASLKETARKALGLSKKADKRSRAALARASAALASSGPGPQGPMGAQGPPGAKGDPCLPTDPACRGPQGAKGDKGDPCLASDPACRGPQGAPGSGTTNFVMRSAPMIHADCFQNCAGVRNLSSTANCMPGERATGGGVEPPSQYQDEVVTASRPTTDQSGQVPIGWLGRVRYRVTTDSAPIHYPAVWVICASASS